VYCCALEVFQIHLYIVANNMSHVFRKTLIWLNCSFYYYRNFIFRNNYCVRHLDITLFVLRVCLSLGGFGVYFQKVSSVILVIQIDLVSVLSSFFSVLDLVFI